MKQTKIDYQPLNGFFDLRNVGFKNGVKDLMKKELKEKEEWK